ncbi:M14 family metallopeptidase [Comamonas humi]
MASPAFELRPAPASASPFPIQWHGWAATEPGPALIILGAVHGNEQSGTHAIRRWVQRFEAGQAQLLRGRLTLVPVANPKAFARNTREGDRNLNRRFLPHEQPLDYEDHAVSVLAPLLASHDALLDLHSYEGDGVPFAMTGPQNNPGPLEPFARAAEELALAQAVGLPRIVQGWLEVYDKAVQASRGRMRSDEGLGTNEFMRSRGGYAITVESGAHDEPAAIEVADRAIAGALQLLGLVDLQPSPQPAHQIVRLQEVFIKRHGGDRLACSWKNFDPFRRGDLLATREDGTPIHAPFDGCMLFPHDDAPLDREWFYLARR